MTEFIERLRSHLVDLRQGRTLTSSLGSDDRHWSHYVRRLGEKRLSRTEAEAELGQNARSRLGDFVVNAEAILRGSIAYSASEQELRTWIDRVIDRALGFDVGDVGPVEAVVLDQAAGEWRWFKMGLRGAGRGDITRYATHSCP